MPVRLIRFLVFAFVLAACVSRIAGLCTRDVFTPFTVAPLPQRATADFDGDGLPDTARIDGDKSVSVQLSTLEAPESLLDSVSELIQGDVDHDGDADLIGTTRSGEIVVWVNDGSGQFTRPAPSPSRGLGFAARLTPVDTRIQLAQVETFVPQGPAWRAGAALANAYARPPTSPGVRRHDSLIHGLRAPPFLV